VLQAALIRRVWGAAHRLRRSLVDCACARGAVPRPQRRLDHDRRYALTRPLLLHGAGGDRRPGPALLAGEPEALVAFTTSTARRRRVLGDRRLGAARAGSR